MPCSGGGADGFGMVDQLEVRDLGGVVVVVPVRVQQQRLEPSAQILSDSLRQLVGVAGSLERGDGEVPQAALPGHRGEVFLGEGGELFFAIDHDQAGLHTVEQVEDHRPRLIERGGHQLCLDDHLLARPAASDQADGQVQPHPALVGSGSFTGAIQQQHRHLEDHGADPGRGHGQHVPSDRSGRHRRAGQLGQQPVRLRVGDLDRQRRCQF